MPSFSISLYCSELETKMGLQEKWCWGQVKHQHTSAGQDSILSQNDKPPSKKFAEIGLSCPKVHNSIQWWSFIRSQLIEIPFWEVKKATITQYKTYATRSSPLHQLLKRFVHKVTRPCNENNLQGLFTLTCISEKNTTVPLDSLAIQQI